MSSKNERAKLVTSIVKDTATIIIYRQVANDEVWFCGWVFHDNGTWWANQEKTWLVCYKKTARAHRRLDAQAPNAIPF